jgi:SAM-dependent methyltransferase
VGQKWDEAQKEELSFWQGLTISADEVFAGLGRLAGLVKFGRRHVGGAASAIELGIGPLGFGWAALAQYGMFSVGVDPLPRMSVETGDDDLDTLCRSLQARTEYLQADATQRLPYDPGSFEVVVCDNVIDHSQAPDAILTEARRLVDQRGLLLFGVNVYSAAGLAKWRRYRRLHPTEMNVVCHPHAWTEHQVLRLLGETGWRVGSVSGVGIARQAIGHSYRLRVATKPA